ncbi:LuxR C-terminal-related transcriptional regulator [Actibacterium ureilyticum]|uniref:LuxR C-terminal-related transcriptional regulator n=1 Tax=Actibacterium ureilyticum TaxID=1590614 RepID=UPI000BAAB3D9|nr:LuxR C-terminal-related transcriptional regulator [Actibacterium ureilyticum]
MTYHRKSPQPRDRTLSGDTRDAAIERLYDVALDPARFETLLDLWESALKPLREQVGMQSVMLLDDPVISNHFKRAEEILDKVSSTGTRAAFDAALAPFDRVAAFLLDDRLMVAAANPAANSILRLNADRSVEDIAVNAEDITEIKSAARAIFTRAGAEAAVLRVRSSARGHFVVLRLQPVQLAGQGTYILAASSEVRCPDGFPELLNSAFGLTPAEAGVVQALVECCSIKEIAEQRGRSVDTVRAQIKSIQSKTETHSQVELVRLALSMMDMSLLSPPVDPGPRVVEPTHGGLQPLPFERLTLRDGRGMDYLRLGDPDGRPLLFLPLDFGLVRWPAAAEAMARARGICAIVPVRPGYGRSDMVAKSVDYDEAFIQDLQELLAALKVTRCPIVSLGDDSFYGFELARRFPQQISALIACAGVLPLTRREQFERMEKWHRFIVAGAKYTPHLLPFMVKAGFFMARKIGKRGFVHAVYGNCQSDIDTFENPEVFEAMVTGSIVALADDCVAHEAFSRMMLGGQLQDWSATVRAVEGRLPVVFINGADDPQVPLATLQEFQHDHPWIDYRVHHDAGQLVFFRHWRDVLDEVEKHL